jgi:tRNA (guanosine-2'-O-)-methyltransferase
MNENSQQHFFKLIQQQGAEKILTDLQTYVSPRRQSRIEQVLNNRIESIQIALEMPADIHNAFAVIRSSEIFGITKVHIITPDINLSSIRPISKGAMDWVELVFYPSTQEFLKIMRAQNFRLACASLQATNTLDSVPIEGPLCLLLGSECSGLTPQAEQACDWRYQIPMFGMTESFNLSVAAAISLYETTRRKRSWLQKSGDLEPNSRQNLQAYYYLNSVNSRLINALFKK